MCVVIVTSVNVFSEIGSTVFQFVYSNENKFGGYEKKKQLVELNYARNRYQTIFHSLDGKNWRQIG